MTPLPGCSDWSSGAEPSRHGERGDSQHFSQEHSQAQVAALWELTDSAWALPVRRPSRSARCPLLQAEYGEQRAVNRFHVVRYERAQESGQEPTLENEEPTEGSEPPTACGALPSARGSQHRESEAGQEAVLRPDRTIRLCHVREDEPAGLITRQASARSRAVLAPCASGVCVCCSDAPCCDADAIRQRRARDGPRGRRRSKGPKPPDSASAGTLRYSQSRPASHRRAPCPLQGRSCEGCQDRRAPPAAGPFSPAGRSSPLPLARSWLRRPSRWSRTERALVIIPRLAADDSR